VTDVITKFHARRVTLEDKTGAMGVFLVLGPGAGLLPEPLPGAGRLAEGMGAGGGRLLVASGTGLGMPGQ
jgi:hypothetical protein